MRWVIVLFSDQKHVQSLDVTLACDEENIQKTISLETYEMSDSIVLRPETCAIPWCNSRLWWRKYSEKHQIRNVCNYVMGSHDDFDVTLAWEEDKPLDALGISSYCTPRLILRYKIIKWCLRYRKCTGVQMPRDWFLMLKCKACERRKVSYRCI